MAEKTSTPSPGANNTAAPIIAPLDDKEKLHASLEERIYTIVGIELLDKDYRPKAYGEAVMMSAGDINHINYNYARIRYKGLYATATRRLKHSAELKF